MYWGLRQTVATLHGVDWAAGVPAPKRDGCADGRTVVLTGSTGFVGAFVLGELLRHHHRACRVVLRASMAPHILDSLLRLIPGSEVFLELGLRYFGDLSAKCTGLLACFSPKRNHARNNIAGARAESWGPFFSLKAQDPVVAPRKIRRYGMAPNEFEDLYLVDRVTPAYITVF